MFRIKSFLTVLVLISISTTALAQIDLEKDLQTIRLEAMENKYSPQYDVEGTRFFYEQWQTGLLYFESGRVSDPLKLKYDILSNKLLLSKKNGTAYVVKPVNIKGFAFKKNGGTIVFKKGFYSSAHNIKREKFLQVAYRGKVKLVLKNSIDTEKNLDVFSGQRTLRFEREKKFFLITKNDVFHKIELEKEEILEVLDNDQRLKQYASKHDLNFDKISDIKRILAFYETLMRGVSSK